MPFPLGGEEMVEIRISADGQPLKHATSFLGPFEIRLQFQGTRKVLPRVLDITGLRVGEAQM